MSARKISRRSFVKLICVLCAIYFRIDIQLYVTSTTIMETGKLEILEIVWKVFQQNFLARVDISAQKIVYIYL